MRKGRESKAPPADLLVCFPARAHLALMPKPVSSPNRPNLKKIKNRGGPNLSSQLSEPSSPKVTCAGQIKARPRLSSEYAGGSSSNCKNLQSVMKEIERIQNTRSKHNRKSKHWAEALGFKKDVMNFLTCLGNIRFDFRCFGSFPGQVDVSSDEEEEEEEDAAEEEEETEDEENNAVFSKWYMVLQEENQNLNNIDQTYDSKTPEVPPPNALLLMRCRSAPAKRGSWLKEIDFDVNGGISREREMAEEKKEREELEEKRKRESLEIVMKYDTDFYNLSTDVSQETWIVGDAFSRSRSWRR